MNGRYLLDTNIVIAYLTGDESIGPPGAADQFFVSSTVVGELFYGAMNSQRVDENTIRLLEFVSDTTSIPCDNETAKVYGELKTLLRKLGRPIPDNDIWIAAVAIQHSLTLLSRDEHFSNIDSLRLERR
jgi:tRNA(fMet)-specific endonuclease VapC